MSTVPLAAHTSLDQEWISEPACTQALRRIRPPERRFWSRTVSANAALATNPTALCGFSLIWCETDQYMDPWSDVGLSMNPSTRDRSAYAMGNPVSFVDTNGHIAAHENGTTVAPGVCNTGLSYNCNGGGAEVHVNEVNASGGCGCTHGHGGGVSYVTTGGVTVVDKRKVVSTLRQGLISSRRNREAQLRHAYDYLESTVSACSSWFDRTFGGTCGAYQQGAVNALHRLDQLHGTTVGFTFDGKRFATGVTTSGIEALGGGSIKLGYDLLNDVTHGPFDALGRTVFGAKLIAQGTVLSGAGIAVDTYRDGTHGFAKGSLQVAVTAGATAVAKSAPVCGRVPHAIGRGACSLGIGFGAGFAAGYGYDETREALR